MKRTRLRVQFGPLAVIGLSLIVCMTIFASFGTAPPEVDVVANLAIANNTAPLTSLESGTAIISLANSTSAIENETVNVNLATPATNQKELYDVVSAGARSINSLTYKGSVNIEGAYDVVLPDSARQNDTATITGAANNTTSTAAITTTITANTNPSTTNTATKTHRGATGDALKLPINANETFVRSASISEAS